MAAIRDDGSVNPSKIDNIISDLDINERMGKVLDGVADSLGESPLVSSLQANRELIIHELLQALEEEGLLKDTEEPQYKWHSYKDFETCLTYKNLVSDTDCLVIVSVGKFIENWLSEAGHRLDELKEGGVYTDKEILEIVKMIEDDPRKSLPCLGPKMVEGEGEVVPVWRDGRSVWHSKKFYFKLIEDFFVGCKKPGVMIWYVGLGQEGTGNWCFKDGIIAFYDIFELYEKHCRGKILTLVTDCNHSGNWVTGLAKALDKKGVAPCGHASEELGYLIKVYASGLPEDKVTQGSFIQEAVKSNRNGITFRFNRLSSGQTSCGLDSTVLRCGSLYGQPCQLPHHPKLKWKDLKMDELHKGV